MEIKWITSDVLALNSNWLEQKGNVLAQILGHPGKGQASGLVSLWFWTLSSALCGFLLGPEARRLQPCQTSHQHTRSRRKRHYLPVDLPLSMRKTLPEVAGKLVLGSHWLEQDHRTIQETNPHQVTPNISWCNQSSWVNHKQSCPLSGSTLELQSFLNPTSQRTDRMHDMDATLMWTSNTTEYLFMCLVIWHLQE